MAGYIGSKAAVTQVDGYTQTEAESRYANVSGDTFTGAVTGTDLTLSGGVYLGGTGSANKLDDYEEGAWTPVVNSGTIRALDCRYTKIGRMVYLRGYFDTWSDQSSATNIYITGLPFTPLLNSDGHSFPIMIRYMTFGDGPAGFITHGGQIRLYAQSNSGNYTIRQYQHWSGSSASLRINAAYETEA